MRILLVDDDVVFAKLVVTKLAELGLHDVTVAHSAEETLALLDQEPSPFDCFLLDIALGDSNGIDLCQVLRMRADNKLAPIIMVTSQRGSALMSRAFTAGATDFMRKPLDHNEVVGRIKTAMLLVELTRKAKAPIGASEIPPRPNYLSDDNVALKPVWFPQIKGMAQFSRFQKKLSELRSRNETPKLYRAHIKDFGAFSRQLDLTELKRHLHTVSCVISDVVSGEQFLFSYLGRGRFIICLQDGISKNFGETAVNLQDRANLLLNQPQYSGLIALQLQVSEITGLLSESANSIPSDRQEEHSLNQDALALDLPRVDEIEEKMFQKALAEEKKQDVT